MFFFAFDLQYIARLITKLIYDTVNPLNHEPAIIFVQKMLSAYYICSIYSNALQANFIMDANTMNPDQTAPKGAV